MRFQEGGYAYTLILLDDTSREMAAQVLSTIIEVPWGESSDRATAPNSPRNLPGATENPPPQQQQQESAEKSDSTSKMQEGVPPAPTANETKMRESMEGAVIQTQNALRRGAPLSREAIEVCQVSQAILARPDFPPREEFLKELDAARGNKDRGEYLEEMGYTCV